MQELNKTLQNLRVRYMLEKLDIHECAALPELQFDYWMKEALSAECDEPNAFVLSTVQQNKPRSRVLLLKGMDQGKFIFYTNYQSAKGHEISLNDHVAMNFLWLPLQRQVRIEGKITKTSAALSDNYFKQRPRGSQLGAIASPQSKIVSSREELEKLFHDVDEKFKDAENLPRPAHWGGYEITPDYFEFWQGRDNRLHDRISYERKGSDWVLARLAP